MDNNQEKPYQKLPFILSAVSAMVVVLACIIAEVYGYMMAAWVSVTIVVFFIIGEFIRFFLVTKVFPPQEEDMEALFDDIGTAIVFDDDIEDEGGEDENNGENENDINDDENGVDYMNGLNGGFNDINENTPVEDSFLD